MNKKGPKMLGLHVLGTTETVENMIMGSDYHVLHMNIWMKTNED
jgi:hypothetical protein